MANRTSIILDTRVLDSIVKNLNGNVAEAVETVAFAIEEGAKINIQQMDAVDTGALLNSVGVSLKSGGDAQGAAAAAKQRRPEAVITPLPKPSDNHTAYVGPQVDYAEEVHFGNGRMAGRPYLLKAVRDKEQQLEDELSKAVRNKS